MSDNKRNRKYSKMKETKRPVILAKRDGGNLRNDKNKSMDDQIQPKILLKSKEKEQTSNQVTIVTRESNEPSSSQSPSNINIQLKERETNNSSTQNNEQLIIPVPIMTRPILLVSTVNYQVNSNALKMFLKTNDDFCVVGVIGMQGVGKSTVLNLLAENKYQTFEQKFIEKDGIFPTKHRSGKCSASPRTEAIHMFITKDRMILLDCPPVLCNLYKRDATTNELDDIKQIILLLSVCHLVIVVQNDYFDLNLIRLLQFAELTKPNHDTKPFISDYVPNILFIKNKAKYYDFLPEAKSKTENVIRKFFKNSKLQIYLEQNDKGKRSKQNDELENRINYFVFPEIKDVGATTYHPNLEELFIQLRNRIFMLPKNQMYGGNSELTESLWFDLLQTTVLNKSHFFLTLYEEIRRSFRDSKNDGIEDI